jgi:hypothetical protein
MSEYALSVIGTVCGAVGAFADIVIVILMIRGEPQGVRTSRRYWPWLLAMLLITLASAPPAYLTYRLAWGTSPIESAPQAPAIPQPSSVATPYKYRNPMSASEVIGMLNRMRSALSLPMSLVVTFTPDNEAFRQDFEAICITAGRDQAIKSPDLGRAAPHRHGPPTNCNIIRLPSDSIDIPAPEHPHMIVFHTLDSTPTIVSTQFKDALGGCFTVRQSNSIPDAINRLNVTHDPAFIWLEVGEGDLRDPSRACAQ